MHHTAYYTHVYTLFIHTIYSYYTHTHTYVYRTYIKKSSFGFSGDRATNYVEIYKQSTYKYLLYIEGHCAACRYGFMMMLGR